MDLVAIRTALVEAGGVVVVVEQPWLVAGHRVAAPPPARLDAAWTAVVTALRDDPAAVGVNASPLLLAGRSAGARVARRTAARRRARAVLDFTAALRE